LAVGRWPARLCGQLAYRLRYCQELSKLLYLVMQLLSRKITLFNTIIRYRRYTWTQR